jgi:UDP-N-acetyl-D-glucosamine dehydrogenase
MKNKFNTVAVIGLGYVGLPLAIAFAEKKLRVVGIDIDINKVGMLKNGESYIEDIPDDQIRQSLRCLFPTTDFSALREADAAIICVPTPLNKTKNPDISHIVHAAELVSKHIHAEMLIVLESTTYPGTTQEILKPLFEENGLKVGRDIFLAYSPERIDPGNKKFSLSNTPKIVGGVTRECTDRAVKLYSLICEKVFPVSSTQAAETTKLLENTFRAVNIALVNEFAQLCHRMKIDVWEVIEAASTKPFGFISFRPGPGIGGHCIPVDPLYLSWKARFFKFSTRLIYLADEINSKMPDHVVHHLFEILNDKGRSIKGSRILILGIAYKEDVKDIRESPALEVIKLILDRGGEVVYNDPHVPEFYDLERKWESVELSEDSLKKADATVIITKHSSYNWKWIVENASCILDCQNATKGISSEKIHKL